MKFDFKKWHIRFTKPVKGVNGTAFELQGSFAIHVELNLHKYSIVSPLIENLLRRDFVLAFSYITG